MARINIQDRTNEFHSILQHASRQNASKKLSQQRQSLLSSSEKDAANGNGKPQTARQRSEFAKQAATIGRGISSTMAKLERLAQLARRKTLFDDRPVEINELTYIIKQDLAQLDKDIRALQSLSASQHPQRSGNADQEGEHNKNVLFLLRGKLGDVTTHFKETLELRTKNIQASRSRTENFISSVASHSNPSSLNPSRTDSPLYQSEQQRAGPSSNANGKQAPYQITQAAQSDILSLEMPSSGSSALTRNAPASSQQLMLMEEGGSNTYIQQRGDAIETIERTMNELGGIFTQLAQMVSEQGEQIQRIDADTEDVLENVQGAQRELLKYWNRVSGNRWLVAKMFGVLMIFFLLWVLIAG